MSRRKSSPTAILARRRESGETRGSPGGDQRIDVDQGKIDRPASDERPRRSSSMRRYRCTRIPIPVENREVPDQSCTIVPQDIPLRFTLQVHQRCLIHSEFGRFSDVSKDSTIFELYRRFRLTGMSVANALCDASRFLDGRTAGQVNFLESQRPIGKASLIALPGQNGHTGRNQIPPPVLSRAKLSGNFEQCLYTYYKFYIVICAIKCRYRFTHLLHLSGFGLMLYGPERI